MNKKPLFLITASVLAIVGLSACTSVSLRGAGFVPASDNVQIVRTTHGIPHVTAANMEMLAYGIAYAHAQDNVCMSADVLATVRGQRSQHFGATATGVLGVRTLPNAAIDAFVQAHMDDAKLKAAWDQSSDNNRAMARGYVAGFNRFLQDHAGKLPAECNGKPWVTPMTLSDIYRATEAIQVQAGAGALADAIAAAAPPARTAQAAPWPKASDDTLQAYAQGAREQLREAGLLDSPLGSNAWAFGKQTTANGRGMLMGNPHYPWVGPSRFYQMHLTIPGQFDVMGAALGWTAAVQIGFNKDVAWSHTVSTGKRFTLHELSLAPGKPTTYLIDGKEEAMVAKKVMVGGREQTIWSSRFGPVLVMPRAGLNWTAERAYAIQDANAGSVRSTDMYILFAKARHVADMRSAMNLMGTPFVNTIVADRAGDVMFADVSGVPDLEMADLQRCAPSRPAAALLNAANLVVLNGSRSDCNWKRDSASPVPGLIAPTRMPVVVRQDWVHNSNDSFFYTHPEHKWGPVSIMVGDDVVRRPRTRSELIEIPEMLGKGKISLAGMQAQLFENRNLVARMVLPDLLAACAQAPNADAKEGCAALKLFHDAGMRNNADAKGAPLFREFWRAASQIPNVYREPFDKARVLATPAGLRMGDGPTATRVWDALAAAVKKMRDAGFALDAPLGQVQRAVFTHENIPLHGGDEMEGVLNNVGDRARPGLSKDGIRIDYGTSYVQTVTFDERGPVAQGLLTYGQSTQAGSPHQTDQLRMYADKRWPSLPYHPEDIERQRTGQALILRKP
ncbi:MAG: penicillin acylase family protein [Limnohabitans sp.]